MARNKIILSLGTIPWMNTKKASQFALDCGFDGIEFVPTRVAVNCIKEKRNHLSLNDIKGLHHTWRLDVGKDKEYGIKLNNSILYNLIRFSFFPKKVTSITALSILTQTLNLPITIHDITNDWILDNNGREFAGGLSLELIGLSKNRIEIKKWLSAKKHSLVIDSRNDQSLHWAIYNGFSNYKKFWNWVGFSNISNYQLTLIGTEGIKKIAKKQFCLAEEQLLWLNKKGWKGSVTVEINPMSLYLVFRNFKIGLRSVSDFIKTSLINGHHWS